MKAKRLNAVAQRRGERPIRRLSGEKLGIGNATVMTLLAITLIPRLLAVPVAVES